MVYVLVFLHFINTDHLKYYQIDTYSDKQECLAQAEKGKNTGNTQLNESDVFRNYNQ